MSLQEEKARSRTVPQASSLRLGERSCAVRSDSVCNAFVLTVSFRCAWSFGGFLKRHSRVFPRFGFQAQSILGQQPALGDQLIDFTIIALHIAFD